MRTYIFFISILSVYSNAQCMSKPPQMLTDEIFCENTPIWRPHSHELILQKPIAQHVRRNPQNPSKTLPALGPLLYTCIYNPQTRTERILEDSHELFFHMKCSDKGTYCAGLNTCKAEFKEIDSVLVFTNTPTNLVSTWNLITQKRAPQFKTAQTSIKMSPHETYIACDSEDNKNFLIRTLADNAIVRSIPKKLPLSKNASYCPSLAESCAFSADDQFVAYAEGGSIQVFDMKLPGQEAVRVPGLIAYFMALNRLVVPIMTTVHVYDTRKILLDAGTKGKNVPTVCEYKDPGFRNNFQFDTESRDKIIGQGNESKNHFRVINLLSGKISEWKDSAIAISPDLSYIATRYAQNTYIEEVNSPVGVNGHHRIVFARTHYMEASHVFFSSSNEYLFFETNSLIYIWNFKKGSTFHKKTLDGSPLLAAPHYTNFIQSGCSPDSQYLLVQTQPSRVTLIDLNRLEYIYNHL